MLLRPRRHLGRRDPGALAPDVTAGLNFQAGTQSESLDRRRRSVAPSASGGQSLKGLGGSAGSTTRRSVPPTWRISESLLVHSAFPFDAGLQSAWARPAGWNPASQQRMLIRPGTTPNPLHSPWFSHARPGNPATTMTTKGFVRADVMVSRSVIGAYFPPPKNPSWFSQAAQCSIKGAAATPAKP